MNNMLNIGNKESNMRIESKEVPNIVLKLSGNTTIDLNTKVGTLPWHIEYKIDTVTNYNFEISNNHISIYFTTPIIDFEKYNRILEHIENKEIVNIEIELDEEIKTTNNTNLSYIRKINNFKNIAIKHKAAVDDKNSGNFIFVISK